ncbi:hypothetical protein BGX28_008196 [Mortierella sp. GBA30]|nr:hypothetical protein BGX28_008196 [Mortierella sp. GBA30]
MVGSDNDFASTLHAYKLERLSFGELSMNTWRKHFSWLRDIDLMFCDALTSTMVQEILCSCPNLKSITAVELHYMDIAAFPQPWVCKGLQIFNIGITLIGAVSSGRVVLPHSRYEQEVLDEDVNAILSRAHRAIYGQIAQLVDLRNLRICNKHVEKLGQKNLLRPSLEFGLGALATLKQLEYFDCGEALVYVRLQESVQIVEWMVEHWASLKAIKRSVKPIFCLTDTEVHTTEAPERL